VIEALALSFTLTLVRVGGFVALLPVLGVRRTPRLVKMGLAVALTVLWFGSPGTVLTPEFVKGAAAAPWLAYGLALGREALLGGLLGYAFGLFLVPAHVAGEYVAQEMGLTIGGQMDPAGDQPAGPVTQLFELLAVLTFFALDGHHLLLSAAHASFARFPVGSLSLSLPFGDLVGATAAVQEWGLLLAAPVGACLFLTSVVLALMARAAPQMNVFSMGFALRVFVGLGALLLLLPGIGAAMAGVCGRLGDLVQGLL